MLDRIYTVGDLRHLLRNVDDDAPLSIAPMPDKFEEVHLLLFIKHEDDNGVVLALDEIAQERDDLEFYAENIASPVRPI